MIRRNPDNDQNYFKPYEILDRTVVDEDGEEHAIKVGVIGFVPPQIMQWDKGNLEGKVVAKDIVETAHKFVPQMKAEGADVIVAIPHSGIGNVTQEGMEENATYDLSKVDGINAIFLAIHTGCSLLIRIAGLKGWTSRKERSMVSDRLCLVPGEIISDSLTLNLN